MDAKVGDWVVTPRRGKAVEINALWYNALRLLEGWVRAEDGDAAARPLAERADQARRSFNERFWYAKGGYLYDVVDGDPSTGSGGDDASCRPNQVLSISLDHPVLDRERWEPVLDVVRQFLLTPVGLRSLAPGAPDYKARYDGDLRAREHLEGLVAHLGEAGVGSISEICDAEPPFTPRGCIAQAWSVAELLRCWVKTAE